MKNSARLCCISACNPLVFFLSAISEDEKAIIRAELTKCFNETTDAIASQLAVLVAKVSRYWTVAADTKRLSFPSSFF